MVRRMSDNYSGLSSWLKSNASDEAIDPRGPEPPTEAEARQIMRQNITNPCPVGKARTTMLNGIPSHEHFDTIRVMWSVPTAIHVGEDFHNRCMEEGKKELFKHASWKMWEFQQEHEHPELLLFGPIHYREIPGGVSGVMTDYIEATIDVFERVTTYLNTLA